MTDIRLPQGVITITEAARILVHAAVAFGVPHVPIKPRGRTVHRGWYYGRHNGGPFIVTGKQGTTVYITLHEFAHHLIREQIYDWENCRPHGPEFKAKLEKVIDWFRHESSQWEGGEK